MTHLLAPLSSRVAGAFLVTLSLLAAACAPPGDVPQPEGQPGVATAAITADLDGVTIVEADPADFPLIQGVEIDGSLVSQIWLDISHVELNGPDGWIVLNDEPRWFDLLATADVSAALGHAVLPADTYQEIRLVLGEGSAIVVDGEYEPLTVPSGTSSGLKLKGPFTVPGGGVTHLTLDMDLGQSVRVNGNGSWRLQPVLHIEEVGTEASDMQVAVMTPGAPLSLELDDGARIDIPGDALSAEVEVWFVRFPPTPESISDWYGLAPMDIELSTAADLRLRYRPDVVDVEVDSLVVVADGEPLPSLPAADTPFVAAELHEFASLRVAFDE